MRYAISAFEGIRGYVQSATNEVRFFALRRHLDRLARTLATAMLPAPGIGSLVDDAKQMLDHNQVVEDCYLRIAANVPALGTLKEAADAMFDVTIRAMGRKEWADEGCALSLQISKKRLKPTDDVFPQHAKVISNYAGPRLAYLDAKSASFDDVILSTSEGFLAESPTANIFLVRDSTVFTPRLCDGILPGITREFVQFACGEMGVPCKETGLTSADAYTCDEAFLVGTGIELAQIKCIDDYKLPAQAPILSEVRRRYFQTVRNLASHEMWS